MKKVIISVFCIIFILVLVVLVNKYYNSTQNKIYNDVENNQYITNEDKLTEIETRKYTRRIVESDNRDFVTLYIETNIMEQSEKILIRYNNDKLLLNTANPLLENIEIVKDEKFNSFYIEVDALKNYSIIFIKKDKNAVISLEDIVL